MSIERDGVHMVVHTLCPCAHFSNGSATPVCSSLATLSCSAPWVALSSRNPLNAMSNDAPSSTSNAES